jgi:hypothetical protein
MNSDILKKIILNDPHDITYIGIGTAVIRDTNPENLQQFPPFIEDLLHISDMKIRLINIDPSFEDELFLKSYIPDLIKVSDNEYKTDRISVIYIHESINIDTHIDSNDLVLLDNINKIIMEQNNLLVVGIYTGCITFVIEEYFKSLYNNTIYNDLYSKLITYDFSDDGNGGCMCNLLQNYPVIDIVNRTIIKFNMEPSTFINYYYQYIDNIEIITKLKNKCKNILWDHVSRNHYIFRNFKNNNILPSMLIYKNRTIFRDINSEDFDIDKLITKIIMKVRKKIFT